MQQTASKTRPDPHRILRGLWAAAPDQDAGLIAPDAMIIDSDQGAMSLRGFTSLKRNLTTALPDHRAHIEDVLWSEGAAPAQAVFRLMHLATHTRDGPLGPASYARLTFRSAMVVQIQGAQVVEVQMIRDQSAMTQALTRPIGAFGRIEPKTGEIHSITHPWALAYADILTAAMDGDFSVFPASYAHSVETWHPGGGHRIGHQQAGQFWLNLRAAVPTGQFQVHSGFGADDTVGPPRVGIAWQLMGDHIGWGLLGRPSGANVSLNGISFAEFSPKGIQREWIVMDLLSLQRQSTPQASRAAA